LAFPLDLQTLSLPQEDKKQIGGCMTSGKYFPEKSNPFLIYSFFLSFIICTDILSGLSFGSQNKFFPDASIARKSGQSPQLKSGEKKKGNGKY
jgi:hypothetical protein